MYLEAERGDREPKPHLSGAVEKSLADLPTSHLNTLRSLLLVPDCDWPEEDDIQDWCCEVVALVSVVWCGAKSVAPPYSLPAKLPNYDLWREEYNKPWLLMQA